MTSLDGPKPEFELFTATVVFAPDAEIHLFGKGSKRTVRVSAATLDLFQELGRGDEEDFVFPSPRGEGHLTRQAIEVFAANGDAAGFHVHPHQRGTAMPRTRYREE